MKTPNIENVVVDEASHRTYVVMASKVLTDGELYSAIRVDRLKHGRRKSDGERVIITASHTL